MSEKKDEECDARDDAQGTEADNIKNLEEIASASPRKVYGKKIIIRQSTY